MLASVALTGAFVIGILGMTIIASISVVADPTEEGLADVTAQLLRADARIIVLFCYAQLGGQIMLSSYKVAEHSNR